MSNQEAKADAGKPKLSLVPRQIIYDIAEVREYGTAKYHDPDNWKRVEKERYRDAAFRHFMKYLDNPDGVDEESGISHLKHLACNIAFLCELEKDVKKEQTSTLGPAGQKRCPYCGDDHIEYDLDRPYYIRCGNPNCKFEVYVDSDTAKTFVDEEGRVSTNLLVAWWNYKVKFYTPCKNGE